MVKKTRETKIKESVAKTDLKNFANFEVKGNYDAGYGNYEKNLNIEPAKLISRAVANASLYQGEVAEKQIAAIEKQTEMLGKVLEALVKQNAPGKGPGGHIK